MPPFAMKGGDFMGFDLYIAIMTIYYFTRNFIIKK